MHTNIHRLLHMGAVLAMIAAVIVVGALGGAARASAAPAVATLPATTCTVASGVRSCDLWAKTGTISLPGASSLPIWGYADSSASTPSLPGPTLIVNQGETVQVTLHNTLPEASSLVFPGQALAPDTVGAPALTGTKTYTFVTTTPGTYIYEAGLTANGARQVALGLYGALIVRPATAGQAYATTASAYDDEVLLVLSEIDPNLNNGPSSFKMQNFNPRYWLINGKTYPSTDLIDTAAGHKVLLRYINAGLQPHSLGLLGLRQTVLASDGDVLPFSRTVIAETMGAGQTLDAIATIPASAPAGTKYALYNTGGQNRNASLRTSGVLNFGGMLAFITVAGAPTGDVTGPISSGASITPSPTTGASGATLSATISDQSTGASGVAAAEYFIDSVGANGGGSAMSGTFGGQSVSVSAAISAATLAGLSSGNHTFYIHGKDGTGNWGAVVSVVLKLDKTGPAISAVGLAPPYTNGATPVDIQATASDVASGNGNVVAAEYAFNGGTAQPLALNQNAPVASATGTIPGSAFTALPDGSYPVVIRARDQLGTWGASTTALLRVDKSGPVASAVSASPNPSNGAIGFNSSVNAVRLSTTLTDSGSPIATGEAFIDTVGALGAGFPLQGIDGLFDTNSEGAYVDIPLPTINLLTSGNHTLFVRGKDAAGNWGATASTVLVIDKTGPTFTGIALAPTPTMGATSVTLTVNGASDGTGSGVVGGEYWINPPTAATPAPGGGTQFSGTTASIPVGSLAPGSYTVSVRVKDAAGNWSTGTNGISTATMTVLPDAIFADGFESPTTLPGNWTSRSTATTSRLNNTTTAALVGARGLQAQGNNTNYVQYNFGTTANPASATYDARFYFNPHGNTGSNQDIFVARTTGGTTLFRVRYRWNGGSPQVQIQVGTGTGNAAWAGITNNASNRIEVVWQTVGSGGPNPGTLRLYVGGTQVQSLTNTNTVANGSVGSVRLGSVTSGGSSTLEYFDEFASKRSAAALIGP